MKQRKPAWRILSALIVAALLLTAPVYLPVNFRVLAASDPKIVVEGADSIQKFSFEKPDEVLLNLAGEVMPRIVIEYVDSTFHASLASPSQDLIDAAGVVAPRIIIQYANSTFHAGLASPPQDLIDAAGVVAPRIIIQYADSTFHRNLVQFPRPQFAINPIDKAREAIGAGKAAELDMTDAEDLLRQAERAFQAGDFGRAKTLAQQAETKAEEIRRAAALQQIDQAKDAITIGSAAELDMTGAEDLLRQAERAFQAGDFGRAKTLAQQAETKAEEIRRAAVLEQIDKAKEAITIGRAVGLDMTGAETLLLQAEAALAARDYKEAVSLAERAKTTAVGIKGAAASQQIDQVKEAITIGRAAELDMTGAETLLLQAEAALAARDYKEAISLAREAKIKAEEISKASMLLRPNT